MPAVRSSSNRRSGMKGRSRLILTGCISLFVLYWLVKLNRGETQVLNLESKENSEEVAAPRDMILYPDKERIGQPQIQPNIARVHEQGKNNVVLQIDNPQDNIGKVQQIKNQGDPPFAHRIVHLDLKGAPPKIGYLKELMPLLKSWGATGFLIEYEDMFPYSGELDILKAPNSYSLTEISDLLKEAKVNGLEVIPLVQTFGHLEMLLKHKKYSHLQEVHPRAINPSLPESFQVIKMMLEQVLAVHPSINYLHIGCDEVYNLGKSKISQRVMKSQGLTRDDLFIDHVMKIAKYVKEKRPTVQPIMWDDMLRRTDKKIIIKSGIGKVMELMVWQYQAEVVTRLKDIMWQKYTSFFKNIWFASAFKGASGIAKFVTNVDLHLQNNLGWVHLARKWSDKINIRGIALTGWSRYDHLAVLCELLPVGLPSLAVNLYVGKHGDYDTIGKTQVRKDLNVDLI